MKSPDFIKSQKHQNVSEPVCTLVEKCDHHNQVAVMQQSLNELLNDLQHLMVNPIATGLFDNHEQLELYVNSFCSIAQPLMAKLPFGSLDDSYTTNVIQLIVNSFNVLKRVHAGGLLMLHGLIHNIEERILPHLE